MYILSFVDEEIMDNKLKKNSLFLSTRGYVVY